MEFLPLQLPQQSSFFTGSQHSWGNDGTLPSATSPYHPLSVFLSRILVSSIAWAGLNLLFYVGGLLFLRRSRHDEAPTPAWWEFVWPRYVLRRDPAVVLHHLVQKYGPVMKVAAWGPSSVLVLSSAAAVEEFVKLHDAEFGARPGSMGSVSIANSVNRLCFPPLEAYWKHLQLVLDMISSEPASSPSASSQGLNWALEALRPHRQVIDHLCEELARATLESPLGLHEPDVAKLPYLQAVVKELFRLHPPCAVSLPHESDSGHRVFGFEVQPRTQVLVNIYSLQRDPAMWGTNAEDFDPVRFLAHPEVDMEGQHFQLLPFGGGRRRCPGTKLAIRHVQEGLARHFSQQLKNRL